MTKDDKLLYIRRAVKRAFPKFNLVFADGSPNSKLMIIGEAPGKDEERVGKPFVGRSGRLLFSTLDLIGWKRSDFYTTNIVKYRPQDEFGGNRTPSDLEIEKFRESVWKEIEVVSPKLIILVGKVAMSGMGILGKIGDFRGKIVEKNNWKFLITYHPAAILRNPNWGPIFKSDLSRINEEV